ncbi:MAG: hypothetical protein ACLFWG_11855, partial [Longimicrobiales bacterium]
MNPSSRQLTVAVASVLLLWFVGSDFLPDSLSRAPWTLQAASAQSISGVRPAGDAFLAVPDSVDPPEGRVGAAVEPTPVEDPDPE